MHDHKQAWTPEGAARRAPALQCHPRGHPVHHGTWQPCCARPDINIIHSYYVTINFVIINSPNYVTTFR